MCIRDRNDLAIKTSSLCEQRDYRPGRFWSRLACLLAAGFALIVLAVSWVSAQQDEGWTDPILLSGGILDISGAPASSMLPVLVGDEWGGVHAFWVAKLDHPSGTIFDTLYYSRWRDASWSSPTDILYMPEDRFWSPQAVVGPGGELHLVWLGATGIWYSRALVSEAGSPQSWTLPIRLSEQGAYSAAIALSGNGDIHVVYCAAGEQERGVSVSHMRSTDGDHWTVPVEIGVVQNGCSLHVATDGHERLHAVFGDQSGLGSGTVIYYSRSDTSGQDWSPPVEIDRKDERYQGTYGPTYPSVATIGEDEVHTIWDGAPLGQRWHQWSADGGYTWSTPEQVSPDQRGLTGPNALAFDGLGRLHMVSMGWLETPDRPFGAFHTFWQDGHWSPMVHIGTRTDWDAEGSAVAIAGGNTLHAAWWHRTGDSTTKPIQVWTSSIRLNAPAIPLRPYPTSPTEPTPQPTARTAATVRPVATPTRSATEPPITALDAPVQTQSAPGRSVWFGILPAALLTILIILALRAHRRG